MSEQQNMTFTSDIDASIFKMMVENAADGVAYFGVDNKVIYANQTFAMIHGYASSDELLGMDVTVFFHESNYQQVTEKIHKQTQTYGKWSGTSRNVRKDGSLFYGWATTFLLSNSNGSSAGTGAIVRDVTEEREQRMLLQQVIDAVPGLLIVKDRDGIFKIVNNTTAEVYDTTPEDLIGKTDADFSATPEEVAFFLEKDHEVLDKQEAIFIPEETITNASGETRYYQTTKVPLVDDDGTADHLLVVASDIHDRKIAEMENDRLREEMLKAQQQALRELSTPIIPLFEGVLVMPLIGSIDTARARDIMRTLLSGITEHRARTIIIDITGVPVVDSGVADHLNKTIQAARLKGAHTIVTGISDAVAETIVDLGIDWNEVETLRDLQSGLLLALERTGINLC